jgi:hypothetical protein
MEEIVKENPTLNISLKSKKDRQGEPISKELERLFVEKTRSHSLFKDTKAAPKGKSKNPYDIETLFTHNAHKELLWIDFKAVNIENLDSNFDSGTFKKVVKFIKDGHFYLIYICVYYNASVTDNIQFVQNTNQEFVKIYLLKDIGDKMHITPNNQIQVNFKASTISRTRNEFLDFFFQKIKESYERRYADAIDMITKLNNNEIRLGNLKKAPKPKKVEPTKKIKTNSTKIVKKDTISLDELKALNQKQEDAIKNL